MVIKRLSEMTNKKEKEDLLFDIVGRFNKTEASALKEYYKKLSAKGKTEFFEDIQTSGIYIHIPPLWEDEPIYNKIHDIYRDYDWIKPPAMYVNRFGRKIKIMKPIISGEIYMIKLKQSSKKNFSARSTGALSKKGIPERSNRNKNHQDMHSSTPIRIGIDENLNSNIGVDSKYIAMLHLFYRSAVTGRTGLAEELATTTKQLKHFPYKENVTNRNVEILQALLKSLGVRYEFIGKKYRIPIELGDMRTHDIDGKMTICTDTEYEDKLLLKSIRDKYRDEICLVGTKEEVEERIMHDFDIAKRKRDKYVIEI